MTLTYVFVLCFILSLAHCSFNRFDLSAGGTYLVNGTFQSFNNLTGLSTPVSSVWAQDSSQGKYFQDLQSGGQYYYSKTKSYAVRNGFCFEITGYTSDTLLMSYGSALSYQIDSNEDNRTYTGLGPSTCGTPLLNTFKVNSRGVIKHWVFQQLSPVAIFCLNVNGQLDFTDSDVNRHFNESILDPPSSCASPVGPYCSNFYFQSGEQCNYAFYFIAP